MLIIGYNLQNYTQNPISATLSLFSFTGQPHHIFVKVWNMESVSTRPKDGHLSAPQSVAWSFSLKSVFRTAYIFDVFYRTPIIRFLL